MTKSKSSSMSVSITVHNCSSSITMAIIQRVWTWWLSLLKLWLHNYGPLQLQRMLVCQHII